MRLRMAVIGCGSMEAHHARDIVALADRIEPVVAVDPERDRAVRAAANLGIARVAADVADVLDEIDAALVVTPHHLHYDIGMTLLKAGKHVLMEKPLALSEDECLELIHLAHRVDRVLMTAYPMRFHPLVVKLKELVDTGVLGEVFQMSIWTEQFTHRPDAPWMHSAATIGGGQLFSHGCHYIDLLLWFLGPPVRGSHFGSRRATPWMEGEGSSNVVIEFASGAVGYHFGTWGARGTKLGYNLQVHGSRCMAEADLIDGEVRLYSEDGVVTVLEGRPRSKYLAGELGHFVDCVEAGISPLTGGPSTLQGLRVIWRLYRAERQHTLADLRGLALGDDWDRPGLANLPEPPNV